MAVSRRAYTAESVQWIFVYLLALGTPFSIYPVITTSTRGLKPFHFFALLIILVGFVRLSSGAALKLNAVTKSVLLFCGVALFSLVGFTVSGGDWEHFIDYISTILQLLIAAGLVVSVSTLNVRRKHLRRLVAVVIAISVIVAGYAIYQSLARMYNLPFAYIEIYNPSLAARGGQGGGHFGFFVRPSSFFTEPSRLGQFLLTPTLISFFLYVSNGRAWNKSCLVIAVVITSAAFILGFSMGAYIAMAGAVFFGLFVKDITEYSKRVILASVGLISSLSIILYPLLGFPLWRMIWVRLVSHLQVIGVGNVYAQSAFAKTSVANRLAGAEEGLQVWFNHPFLGVGINNFKRFYPEGSDLGLHSALVQSLAEMGILGGLSFLVLTLLPPITLLKKRFSIGGWQQSIYIAVALGLLGRAVWMMVSGNYILEFFWLDIVIATVLLSYESGIRSQQC